MTVSDDVAAVARDVATLRASVLRLQGRLGDTVDAQRLRDDVARVNADLALLARAAREHLPVQEAEKIYIPDGDYDPSFWTDAEDEGLGARGRAR
ncbi:MAG: hypothetical protein ABIV05_00425 [Actinomycetota bacterium]